MVDTIRVCDGSFSLYLLFLLLINEAANNDITRTAIVASNPGIPFFVGTGVGVEIAVSPSLAGVSVTPIAGVDVGVAVAFNPVMAKLEKPGVFASKMV